MTDEVLVDFVQERINDEWSALVRDVELEAGAMEAVDQARVAVDDAERVMGKQALLDAMSGLSEHEDRELRGGAERALRMMAGTYRWHSDFRPEWAEL